RRADGPDLRQARGGPDHRGGVAVGMPPRPGAAYPRWRLSMDEARHSPTATEVSVAQALTASEVARLVGVAVTTLRTWDRRYGLGPPGHEAGKHRRYRDEDVRRLAEMRRLTASGVPPGQAAAWVLARP